MSGSLSPDVIGLLILEELKAMRRDLKEEVQMLRLQLLSKLDFGCQPKSSYKDGMTQTHQTAHTKLQSCSTQTEQIDMNTSPTLPVIVGKTVGGTQEYQQSKVETNPVFDLQSPPIKTLKINEIQSCSNNEPNVSDFPFITDYRSGSINSYPSLDTTGVSMNSLTGMGSSITSSLPTASYATFQQVNNGQQTYALDKEGKLQGRGSIVCPICRKCFTKRNSLRLHMRTHTGEKPFKCYICKKRFTQGCNLNVHIRTHTGEKPYRCNVCGRHFTAQSGLNNHKAVHHSQRN